MRPTTTASMARTPDESNEARHSGRGSGKEVFVGRGPRPLAQGRPMAPSCIHGQAELCAQARRRRLWGVTGGARETFAAAKRMRGAATVDTCHSTSAQTHGTRDARSEPWRPLRTLGDNDRSAQDRHLRRGHHSDEGRRVGRLCVQAGGERDGEPLCLPLNLDNFVIQFCCEAKTARPGRPAPRPGPRPSPAHRACASS